MAKRITALIVALFLVPPIVFALVLDKDVARYEFEYRVTVPELPDKSQVRLWIPYPIDDRYQRVIKADIQAPLPWRLEKEDKYGNRMVYIEGPASNKRLEIVLRYEIERKISFGIPKSEIDSQSTLNPKLYLAPNKLVPFTKEIKRIANQETAGIESSSKKIRALYNYIVKAMSYNKSGKGWGKGDAIWACSTRRGNCTDFHSLYIALARTQGIPARFEIGFPIPKEGNGGKIPGYHCWAQVYDVKKGWFPLDASEAKKSGKIDDYFGKIPNNRIQFSIGRDLNLSPKQKGEPINYFIYPHIEVDDVLFSQYKTEFHFKRLKPLEVKSLHSSFQ